MFFYSSKACQKKHWKEGHKFVCKGLPYKIGKSADLGRFLEAAKDLKKGEVLWKEPPLITGPIAVSPPVCLCCYTRVDGSYKYVQVHLGESYKF